MCEAIDNFPFINGSWDEFYLFFFVINNSNFPPAYLLFLFFLSKMLIFFIFRTVFFVFSFLQLSKINDCFFKSKNSLSSSFFIVCWEIYFFWPSLMSYLIYFFFTSIVLVICLFFMKSGLNFLFSIEEWTYLPLKIWTGLIISFLAEDGFKFFWLICLDSILKRLTPFS